VVQIEEKKQKKQVHTAMSVSVYPAQPASVGRNASVALKTDLTKAHKGTKLVTVNPSDIKRVSDRDYPLCFGKDKVEMVVGSLPHQFWVLISQRGEGVDTDPYTELRMETTEKTFARTARAYDTEMDYMCEYIGMMDKLDHLDANNPLCNRMDRLKLTMDIEAGFTQALNAKAYREQRAIISSAAQRDRLERLRQAICVGELFQEQSKKGDSFYSWEPSTDLIKTISDEINELSEGVQLSGWYVAMSYMMYRTGRPFFSPVELPRECISLPVDEDPLWKCPFGMSSRQRWVTYVNDREYASR
jgi:hypothetical protein